MLAINHLSKSFGSKRVLHDISVPFAKAKRTVVQGHSGCGKTTLLRCIAGLERPEQGTITIAGRTVTDGKKIVPAHQRGVGMVFQDLALWPHMSVYQNVAFHLKDVIPDKKKQKEEVLQILRQLQIESKVEEPIVKLSGGEKQRVAIARTLIRRPKILLMDEPFANLDSPLKRVLIQLLIDLQQQFTITLIYVTHDEDMVEQLADEAVYMDQGRVIKTEVFQ